MDREHRSEADGRRDRDQLSSALALIELDGIAASLVIAPPERDVAVG